MVFQSSGVREAPIAVKHNAIAKDIMVEWVLECERDGKDMPTDEQIMDRFAFHSLESARTLLADLSDEGRIKIVYANGARSISSPVKREPPQQQKFERPRNSRSERLDQIAKVAERLKARKEERAAVEVETSDSDSAPLAPAAPSAKAPESRPPVFVPPVTAVHATVKDGRNPCTHLTLRIDKAVKRDITRRAAEQNVTINSYVSDKLMGALYGETGQVVPPPEMDIATTVRALVTRSRSANQVLTECIEALAPWILPDRKLRIRVDIAAEALRLGQPVIEFMTDLAVEAMARRKADQNGGAQ